MKRQLILPPDFDDYEWEVESKGYFEEAAVMIGGRALPVTFYEPTRLAQDIAEELDAGRVFSALRLIVVESVTRDAMQASVLLADAGVFE